MSIVDASVWVSYYNALDVNHTASLAWVPQQLANQTSLIGPTLVLPEVGGAIGRRVNQVEAQNVVNNLKSWPLLILIGLDEPLALIAANLAIDLRLRGADAVYVAVAQQLNLPLVTWDREIINRTASIIQAHTP